MFDYRFVFYANYSQGRLVTLKRILKLDIFMSRLWLERVINQDMDIWASNINFDAGIIVQVLWFWCFLFRAILNIFFKAFSCNMKGYVAYLEDLIFFPKHEQKKITLSRLRTEIFQPSASQTWVARVQYHRVSFH